MEELKIDRDRKKWRKNVMKMKYNPITPTGTFHKSRGDNVVRMWVQLKR